MNGKSDGERLMRIETILERMEPKVNDIRDDLNADKADLAALKNKGAGILIGVAIAAGGIGAGASTFWKWIVGLFG